MAEKEYIGWGRIKAARALLDNPNSELRNLMQRRRDDRQTNGQTNTYRQPEQVALQQESSGERQTDGRAARKTDRSNTVRQIDTPMERDIQTGFQSLHKSKTVIQSDRQAARKRERRIPSQNE